MPNTARKVIQCDRSGNDLREFASAKEAALSFGSTNGNAINKAIRHGNCTFGYRWRYADEPIYIKPKGTPGKSRSIVAIDENGTETLFSSLSEASRKLGIGISAIESALHTGCAAKSYHFRYDGEPIAKSFKREKHRKAIIAIDDEDQVVGEYVSAYECAAKLGVIPAAVYRCLNKNNPDAKCKGYRLRYQNDDE